MQGERGQLRPPQMCPDLIHLFPPLCSVHFGSWFQHIKGWLACKEDLGLFFITYEELHQVSSAAA